MIASFTKVSVKGNVDVFLYRDEKEGVDVPDAWINKVTVDHAGDVLFIDAGNINGIGKAPVMVRYKQLSGLSVNGNGEVTCDSDIKASKFDLVCKGSSGWIKLTSIQVSHINITIIGNKNLEVTGTARSKSFDIQGSGRHLFNLSAPVK